MCKITKQFTLDFPGTAGSSLPQEHAGLKHFDGRFLFHFVIYFLKVNFDVSFCIFAATLYSAVKKKMSHEKCVKHKSIGQHILD